jgi:hypothetical protein
MTAQVTSAQADRLGRRMAVSRSGLTGIGYAAAWIISQSVGAPMFLLGAMALAISQLARRSLILPRWLAPLGALLAAALVTSGLGFLLLIPGLASAVYVSGILLLIFVSATGIALRSAKGGRPCFSPT